MLLCGCCRILAKSAAAIFRCDAYSIAIHWCAESLSQEFFLSDCSNARRLARVAPLRDACEASWHGCQASPHPVVQDSLGQEACGTTIASPSNHISNQHTFWVTRAVRIDPHLLDEWSSSFSFKRFGSPSHLFFWRELARPWCANGCFVLTPTVAK